MVSEGIVQDMRREHVMSKDQIGIYLCCGGGLSSGFLAQQGRKAAKKRQINALVEAKSESEVTQYLPKMDVLCIGPHYAFRLDAFRRMAEPYNVPVVVIPEDTYSMLDGNALIDLALSTIEKNVG